MIANSQQETTLKEFRTQYINRYEISLYLLL